ncbi:hypothetical protein P3X46_019591 [Hevea brasiliensis]|uniref:Mechanosensitive ion channel MscS domain-containing protein n=1 Tax=Hevea brasiliensis TaxID=3981 RepID=A0ABQ9LL65_HEVBR|nr:mechanosensitive ion channel protein 10 [Hevea brasiliensis]KAJ9168012.1 hypothetical protein P3X46_019591 [Hevea brasiliensis]
MAKGTDDVRIPMPNGKDGENKKGWKFYTIFVGSIVFSCIIFGLLISSLTVDRLQNSKIWDFELWKWCVLLLVVLGGGLTVYLFLLAVESLIIKNFLFKVEVVYYYHGMKKSVLVFIWLALVFLAWGLLFYRGDNKLSEGTKKTIDGVTRGIGGCLIGVAMWLVKTLLVKLVASFHMKTLFEKIKAADRSRKIFESISTKQKPQDGTMKYTTTELFDAIRNKKLPNLCYEEEEITDENRAANAANEIFKKFERGDDERYIDMNELLEYIPDDADDYKHFKEAAEEKQMGEGKQIKRSVFRSWVVSLYNSYDSVNSALKQRKTAVDELNKLFSVVVLLVIIVVWLLFMEYLNIKVLVFMSSQILLVVFMFGNAAKTVFESIIFVFIMHPFDVGDRCVVDGIQMIVEEMEILTTNFLKYDNEKIYYPNSVLATKPISNLYRSPPMSDSFEFAIDLHTSKEKIENLQASIREYFEANPRRWSPASDSLQFKEIEDMNKMKVALYFKHTINFHNVAKRFKRRSELVLAMKDIFEKLMIKYYLLPQRVHLIDGPSLGKSSSLTPAVQRRSFSF